jgi:hypothetical protein
MDEMGRGARRTRAGRLHMLPLERAILNQRAIGRLETQVCLQIARGGTWRLMTLRKDAISIKFNAFAATAKGKGWLACLVIRRHSETQRSSSNFNNDNHQSLFEKAHFETKLQYVHLKKLEGMKAENRSCRRSGGVWLTFAWFPPHTTELRF